MIEPITSRSSYNPVGLWDSYPIQESEITQPRVATNESVDKSEEEIVSFYYLSTIQSMQAFENSNKESLVVDATTSQIRPSALKRLTGWIRGLFGVSGAKELTAGSTEVEGVKDSTASTHRIPQLQAPEEIGNDRLSKAIAELNRELLYRMKDTAEFETEMLKSNSKKMDRLILVHIVAKSLEQKKLKEVISLEAHENVLELQNRNKDLHKKYFQLLEDINATAKTNRVLHWVNLGATAGIVGSLAVSFATSGAGAVLAIALPALNIVKGGLSTAEGLLKYEIDKYSGDLGFVNYQEKTTRGQISDKVSTTIAFADEDISNLLKTIRHQLENYSKEARYSPQFN